MEVQTREEVSPEDELSRPSKG